MKQCRSKQQFHLNSLQKYLPNTIIFFPDGNFELDRVETSLSIEDLQAVTRHTVKYCERQMICTSNIIHYNNSPVGQ